MSKPESFHLVTQKTNEIKELISCTAQNIVEIGQKLREVKQLLGHGHFGLWLKKEFQWSVATATKMMQVSQRFKNINFTNLSFSPSALYVLAAPSTPDSAYQEALTQAQKGVPITYSLSKELVRRHRSRQALNQKVQEADKQEKAPTRVPSKPIPLTSLDSFLLIEIEEQFTSDFLVENRFFFAYLTREWRRMLRNQQSLALICCTCALSPQLTVPSQKKILTQVSQIFTQSLQRPGDLGTYTTETTFWLLLSETNLTGSLQVVKGIRQQLQSLAPKLAPSSQPLSVSFGVCSLIPSQDISLKSVWNRLTKEKQKLQEEQWVIRIIEITTDRSNSPFA